MIACDMNALDREERDRYQLLLKRLAPFEATEIADGYEISVDAGKLAELAEWISLESRCCPFLKFEVALRLTGGDGVKEFLAAEFVE